MSMHIYLEHHSKSANVWGSTQSAIATLHIAVGHHSEEQDAVLGAGT